MLRRRRTTYPFSRLKDWADSGESLLLRCAACAAETRLRPAALIARHGWHGAFASAVDGITCAACGGATELVPMAGKSRRFGSRAEATA